MVGMNVECLACNMTYHDDKKELLPKKIGRVEHS